MFVDLAKVMVQAGNGGGGAVSFRHEIYVDKGGPDGGDGGKGGNVVFVASPDVDTLVNFRFKPELKAQHGETGGKRKKHGKSGKDLEVKVPTGTVVKLREEIIADLVQEGQRVVVARGGDGGFGNAHFKSSTRQAPRVAEKGEKGETYDLGLELKLIADVGLLGKPNAGKSTFLSVVSNAKPEIANYEFTTLSPHLGVADIDDGSLLVADIPGIIEGAAEGKGLGHEFLRHVERTGALLHLIDAYSNSIQEDYKIIRSELALHDEALAAQPELVAITKIEGLDDDIVEDILSQLKEVVPSGTDVVAISSQSGAGIKQALRLLRKLVVAQKAQEVKEAAAKQSETTLSESNVYTLETPELAWQVVKAKNGEFKITGHKIEKFARRTEFSDYHGRQRLRDIMKKMGIAHDLRRKGAKPDSLIRFGRSEDTISIIEQED